MITRARTAPCTGTGRARRRKTVRAPSGKWGERGHQDGHLRTRRDAGARGQASVRLTVGTAQRRGHLDSSRRVPVPMHRAPRGVLTRRQGLVSVRGGTSSPTEVSCTTRAMVGALIAIRSKQGQLLGWQVTMSRLRPARAASTPAAAGGPRGPADHFKACPRQPRAATHDSTALKHCGAYPLLKPRGLAAGREATAPLSFVCASAGSRLQGPPSS